MDSTSHTPTAEHQSLSELIGELGQHGYELLSGELELAKAEASESIVNIGVALALISIGAAVLSGALLLLLSAAVLALGTLLPYWASALIVGAIALVVATIVLLIGRSKLRIRQLIPEHSVTAVKRDTEMVKQQMS